MNVRFSHEGIWYQAELTRPVDISIPLDPDGQNPNCFYAPPPSKDPVRAGNFVGSVEEGGFLNFFNIHLNPHGNGTHTECAGHISESSQTINSVLKRFHFLAELTSIFPTLKENGDRSIGLDSIKRAVQHRSEALIIRTLPNPEEKQNRVYSGTNPPYFEPEAMEWLADQGFIHFLTDLPSVDKEKDEGLLAAHKNWWNYPRHKKNNRTITELIYVPDKVKDGVYLLNLQIASLELDASPSKPVLYDLRKLNEV